MATTPSHALRIPMDVWRAAVAKTKAEDTTVTAIVVSFLRWYNAGPPLPAPKDTKP